MDFIILLVVTVIIFLLQSLSVAELFHVGGLYNVETSPLICRANKWTCLYMIGTSAKKELRRLKAFCHDL